MYPFLMLLPFTSRPGRYTCATAIIVHKNDSRSNERAIRGVSRSHWTSLQPSLNPDVASNPPRADGARPLGPTKGYVMVAVPRTRRAGFGFARSAACRYGLAEIRRLTVMLAALLLSMCRPAWTPLHLRQQGSVAQISISAGGTRRHFQEACDPADEFHTRQITSKVDGAELV
jgi:hypothetical protein